MAIIESQSLLTAEQYAELPDDGRPTELVRGRIVEMNMPNPRHGQVCANVAYLVRLHAEQYNCGHVVSNDSGVVTERNPDSVRGADIAYYSFARVPKGRLPARYLTLPPDVVFEVRSPSDRTGEVEEKTAEYLKAEVKAVSVLDPDTDTIHVHRPGQEPQVLQGQNELVLPETDGPFRVRVSQFFD
jgi:Uma2 family endonuclease